MFRRNPWLVLLFSGMLLLPVTKHAQDAQKTDAPVILRINIDGTINPAVDDYISGAIKQATEQRAVALLIHLNTPGGLLDSTRTIVQTMLTSEIPIIVWVGPPGARAASAGMFITMAANIAAMAHGTNIGAATPISGGGKDVDEGGNEDLAKKVLEDTRAFARSIAQVRDRPEAWMEATITEAVSVTSDEALEQGAIDLIADNDADLLEQLHGREIKVASGSVTLNTQAAVIEPLDMRPGQKLMHHLSHPNIAYLLMLLGMLGIYFELSAPGGFIAGTLGSISLLLAFISFQVLPFRAGGLLLILLSIVLFVAEVFVPSMGILTVGGVVSFVVGSLILFNTPELDVHLDPGLIAGATAAFAVCTLAVGFLILKAHRRRPDTGSEGMVGQPCEALTELNPAGKVFLMGEIWNAELVEGTAEKGDRLEIVAVEGLRLQVRPKTKSTE